METAISVEPSALKSNIEWGPILGGAAIATATGVILLTFGTAVGLTVTSPYEGEGLSPVAFAVGAGLYFLWVQIMAFYMGGYVTGRLRGQAPGASEHEVDVRDGLHGLVMWGVAVLAAGFIAVVGLGGVGAAATARNNELTASVGRVVEKQVNESASREAVEAAPSDATAAERKAEVARKLTVISAFITAASLLIGAVAAFYGAHSGGNHRDKNTRWDFFHSRARVISIKTAGQ
jgi:hypothetical protein